MQHLVLDCGEKDLQFLRLRRHRTRAEVGVTRDWPAHHHGEDEDEVGEGDDDEVEICHDDDAAMLLNGDIGEQGELIFIGIGGLEPV